MYLLVYLTGQKASKGFEKESFFNIQQTNCGHFIRFDWRYFKFCLWKLLYIPIMDTMVKKYSYIERIVII